MRKYRTIQGDTWDKIAFREYAGLGGEKLMSELISNNEKYADYVVFPAGLMLNIPDQDTPEIESVPPWYK